MTKLITSLLGSLILIWCYEIGIVLYWAADTEVFSLDTLSNHHHIAWGRSITRLIWICTGLLFLWLYLRPEPKCDKSDAQNKTIL